MPRRHFFPIACLTLALAACGDREPEPADSPNASSSARSPDPAAAPSSAPKPPTPMTPALLDLTLPRLNGDPQSLAEYAGKVILVVNTASECGFAPQFEGLESLYESRRAKGLVILGFPADDFAGQEPRSNPEIAEFCKSNYGVKFPMFAKSTVIGDGINPLFAELPPPEWNFNKYLIDRDGKLVAHWGAETTPQNDQLIGAIDKLL